MIIYRCDVCELTTPGLTSYQEMHRLMPRGWRSRSGRVPCKNKRDAGKFHEVAVHVCSDSCAKQYDLLEADQVGLAWSPPSPCAVDIEDLIGMRPLKATGGR